MWWLCDFARSELRNSMNQIFVGTIVSTRTNGPKRGGVGGGGGGGGGGWGVGGGGWGGGGWVGVGGGGGGGGGCGGGGGGGLPPEHNQIKCKEIMAFYTEYQLYKSNFQNQFIESF